MSRVVYLDNAATTKTSPKVVEAMLPYFSENYGNPSSIYSIGGTAKLAVDEARAAVAKSIGAKPEEIYFTAGGSESDNWAIKMVAENLSKKGRHIITSAIEHHAVLHIIRLKTDSLANVIQGVYIIPYSHICHCRQIIPLRISLRKGA